ncbi:hypothetical protein Ddye_025375 [Dipteronia dyeriana]|uniref:DDE Tnp4 domain-containing protein n=1 Tax=Dipteronia dyeriana TaxID=168575 RepID=A0AAD9TWQ5_9ROSI|nr:hypothetical protein Ddye_025375 [Dipteronia dyeriana]
MLTALNTLSKDMTAKPELVVPTKIRENTKFFPYFKGNISQNVLAACNFYLEFMYVLAGWEGSAHDSKLLNDTLSRKNGFKVPQGNGNDPENERNYSISAMRH